MSTERKYGDRLEPETRLVLAVPPVDPARMEAARSRVKGTMFGRPMEPQSVGRFVLLRKVGSGAMGVVHAAYDNTLDRKVAIKLIQHERAQSGEAQQRLFREAKAMARLSHNNVVHVYDAGEDHGQLFIAMEFVAGETLRMWLERRQPGWREVVDLFRDIAAGLAAAHESGVVHRDFKPDNVMVDEAGVPKVADFGLAGLEHTSSFHGRAVDTTDGSELALTQTGTVLGSPQYMSPEQHRGVLADPKSDQFSYCVTLWEALHGSRPFDGKTLPALRESLESTRPTSPPHARTPRWLDRVLERGLRLDPDQRWPSMQVLLAELARGRSRSRRGVPIRLAALVGIPLALSAVWGFVTEGRVACSDVETAQLAERSGAHFAALDDDTTADNGGKPLRLFQTRVEDYAKRWSEQWIQVCVDRRADVADVPTSTARSDCLDARREDLERLVTQVTRAPALLRRSTAPIELPRDPRECRRMAAGTIARSPQRVRGAAAVDEALREAWLAQVSGDYAGSLALAEQAHGQATALDLGPERARSLLRIGVSQARLEAADEARASLRDAASVAESLGLDALVGEVFGRMVEHAAQLTLDPQRGELLFHQALAKLERRDALGDDSEADLRAFAGNMYMKSGDAVAAHAEYQRAVRLYSSLHGPNDFRVAASQSNLAAVLSRLGRNDEALPLARAALERQEAVLGVANPRVADTIMRLGIILLKEGRLEAALDRYRQAVDAYRASEGAQSLDEAVARVEIADVLLRLNAPEDAVASIERAMAIYQDQPVPAHRLPQRHRAHHIARVVFETVERWPDALAEVRAEQRLIPQVPGKREARSADAKLLEVRYLLELRRPDEAAAVLRASDHWLRASGRGETVDRLDDYMRRTFDR